MNLRRIGGWLAAGAAGFRLWCEWCAFPGSTWNAIRLAPSFMLRFGPTPYPGLEGGPVTTWIYGPVPLLLNLPATLAAGTAPALLVAGALNLLLAVVPAALFAWWLPGPRPTTAGHRMWTLLLILALWPNSGLRFIQADNAAVAFGLTANLLLLRRHLRTEPGTGASGPDPAGFLDLPTLGAAGLTALAVWSKQVWIALVGAQLLWLAVAAGPRAAWRYGVACAVAGGALGAVFLAWFGWDGLWLNLVRLPGRLPASPEPLARLAELAPHLTGFVVLPAVAVLVCHRRVFSRQSPWLLPILSWLALLPFGLAAVLKVGGNANSLSGVLCLLPALALVAATSWENRPGGVLRLAGVVIALNAAQLAFEPARPLRPVTAQLGRADYLAREFPGQIYFPWNPLVTFFSDRRFYHAEDGLYVRAAAGLGGTPALIRRDLPPRWVVTAHPSSSGGWGIVERLQPANASRQAFGEWTLDSWPEPAPP